MENREVCWRCFCFNGIHSRRKEVRKQNRVFQEQKEKMYLLKSNLIPLKIRNVYYVTGKIFWQDASNKKACGGRRCTRAVCFVWTRLHVSTVGVIRWTTTRDDAMQARGLQDGDGWFISVVCLTNWNKYIFIHFLFQ